MFAAYVTAGTRFLDDSAYGTSYPTLAALAAGFIGATCAFGLHAAWVLWLGARSGVQPYAVAVGVGPARRSWLREGRAVVLQRVPLPLVRVVPAYRFGPGLPGRFRVWAATLLAIQVGPAALLLKTAGPFGAGIGVSLGGVGLVVVAAQHGRMLLRPLSPAELDRRGLLAGSGLQAAALHALAGRPAAARQALADRATRAAGRQGPEEPGVEERLLRAWILLLEGDYTQAAADTRTLAETPGLSRSAQAAAAATQARALAYADERGDTEAGTADHFLALIRDLRDAPASATSGTDLTALYHLVKGNIQDALHEARQASRAAAAPADRCLALCTLATALHHAGNTAEARQTASQARTLTPEIARTRTVLRLLTAPGTSRPAL